MISVHTISGWSLFPGPFYDLKVCHKIFIMLVEEENLSSQLRRQFLCMRFANNFTIYTCISWMRWFSPIHHRPEATGWRGGVGDRSHGEKWLQGNTRPALCALSDIYTMFYKEVSWGELLRCTMVCFRCHTVVHYAARSWINNITFSFHIKLWLTFIFHVQTDFCMFLFSRVKWIHWADHDWKIIVFCLEKTTEN